MSLKRKLFGPSYDEQLSEVRQARETREARAKEKLADERSAERVAAKALLADPAYLARMAEAAQRAKATREAAPAPRPTKPEHVHTFVARRSGARRVFIGTSIATLGVFGAPALLAGKNQARCVTCGQKAK